MARSMNPAMVRRVTTSAGQKLKVGVCGAQPGMTPAPAAP